MDLPEVTDTDKKPNKKQKEYHSPITWRVVLFFFLHIIIFEKINKINKKTKQPMSRQHLTLTFRKTLSFVIEYPKTTENRLIFSEMTADSDGEIPHQTARENFSIYFRFCSIDECTYLFRVSSTEECPKISDKAFTSNPIATQFEANK